MERNYCRPLKAVTFSNLAEALSLRAAVAATIMTTAYSHGPYVSSSLVAVAAGSAVCRRLAHPGRSGDAISREPWLPHCHDLLGRATVADLQAANTAPSQAASPARATSVAARAIALGKWSPAGTTSATQCCCLVRTFLQPKARAVVHRSTPTSICDEESSRDEIGMRGGFSTMESVEGSAMAKNSGTRAVY